MRIVFKNPGTLENYLIKIGKIDLWNTIYESMVDFYQHQFYMSDEIFQYRIRISLYEESKIVLVFENLLNDDIDRENIDVEFITVEDDN
ncbi:hypothetical protein MKY30_16215 [Oceanobacillus sp. FSL W8-0428]|uniref:hypothetical protein n=1 Tax=Oceanobacillus sp. FSL W8-0428 TaxID=2921715 RepID=UPI0030F8A690